MTYRGSGSLLRAGTAVDMPVRLTEPLCDDGVREHVARVDYTDQQDRARSATIAASDDSGAVAALHEQECFEAEVRRSASIAIQGLPEVERRQEALTAGLTVVVTGTGQGGELTVLRAGSTTLLQPVDADTGRHLAEGLPIGITAPRSGTSSFTIPVVPGRCDAHALAEDKQGTRFPLHVELDGRQGVVTLVSSDRVRAALYTFVQEACQDQQERSADDG